MKPAIPLSLYIHFPWCVRKCPYCDFNSHEIRGSSERGEQVEVPESAYINALISDLDRDLQEFQIKPGTTLASIFMGGGTPSIFSPESMRLLMEALHARLEIRDETEITLEANPGTTDFEKYAGYRNAGIDRLSIGVQSFGSPQLEALGRIHTANEATQSFAAAREAGFDNINLDLMHGLPQQDTQGALFDLETAIQLSPEHISWYQLTLEPNTAFYSKPPTLPSDDQLWEIYQTGMTLLSENNYSRYEVSAFSQPGKRAAHNVNYWQFGDYLGIGAGAHGKITRWQDGVPSIVRTNKTRQPGHYLQDQKLIQNSVPQEEITIEFLMNTLRTTEGFSREVFESRTGLAADSLNDFVDRGVAKKLLDRSSNRIYPTEFGLQFLNDLLLIAEE